MATQLGNLIWRPGLDTSGSPYFTTTAPEAITHTLRLRMNGRGVDLGFNKHGGGYLWSHKLRSFSGVRDGKECGIPGYGRGMLGSLRSKLQHGMHNPIQSGRFYNIGVTPQVVASPGVITVRQFAAPLFDDQEFNFNNHRSEFDFACRTADVSARYGVCAFEHQEFFVWAREPDALREFLGGQIHSGPYAGENILDRTALIRDISQFPGAQEPDDLDYSRITQTIKSLRLPTIFKYLHYRVGDHWVSTGFTGTAIAARSAVTPGQSYVTTSDEVIRPARATMDYPFYALSTHVDPTLGTAVGLYIPQDHMNAQQVKIIAATGEVRFMEDRRYAFLFTLSKQVGESHKGEAYNVMLARCLLSGMLNPQSATRAYGFNAVEAITNKSVVLYGTPADIFAGVKADAEQGK